MNTLTSKGGICKHCDGIITALLTRNFSLNGAETFSWTCPKCSRLNPFGGDLYIAHAKIKAHLSPEIIDALPTRMPEFSTRCAKCGNRGVELHHWAPQSLFEDANNWPMDYLCVPCHNLWHSKVTPSIA